MRRCLRGFPILLKFVSSYQKEVTLDRRVLRDDQWKRIAPLLPGKVGDAGRSGADNRLFVEAVLGAEGPTVRDRTVRNRIFSQISPSACVRRWIGHQKLNSAALMREIMAGMWDFPCFGPARVHLSRIKRVPIARGHNAGNTDAVGGATVPCRIPEQPAVRTSNLTRSRFQSP